MTVESRVVHHDAIAAARARPVPAARAPSFARRLREAGRAGAATGATGEALAQYWRQAGTTPLAQRVQWLDELRAGIATGRTSPRACIAIALGEHDLELARSATRAYVGTWPASLERREQALLDVIDWIERGLALNRAALCCALLDAGDEPALARLAPLRGRLSEDERAAVLAVCTSPVSEAAATLLEAWRAG